MCADRWDPFGEMGALHDRLNRAFEEMVSRRDGPAAEPSAWAPLVDILETDRALVFRADLAGVRVEDLAVELDGNTLTLTGRRKTEDAAYLRIERPHGPLRRSFTIGTAVDPRRVKATYRNGVLEIVLPKSGELNPQRVKVQLE
jgi:HSP20 family protein